MSPFTFIVLRCPHDEQRYAMKHANALVAFFAIGFTCVFAGEQVTIEESFQISKVDTMIFQIRSPLALVPRVYVGAMYMRYAYAARGKGPNTLRLSGWRLLTFG